jgi:mRNA interferase HicA
VKRKDLERKLRELGWEFKKHGGNHDLWQNSDGLQTAVPRHAEVNENLAKSILKKAGGK